MSARPPCPAPKTMGNGSSVAVHRGQRRRRTDERSYVRARAGSAVRSPERARARQYADVSSWRDSLSKQALADVDVLLDAVVPLAQQMLEERGEFFPYAMKLTEGGDTAMVAVSEGERPASTEMLAKLYLGLNGERQTLRATAVVSDVRIAAPAGGAIRVEIEHRDGAAIAMLLPYSKKPFGRGVTYGDLQAMPGEPKIWSDA
jgi:hypothetical protein